jgi:hypothetical protein
MFIMSDGCAKVGPWSAERQCAVLHLLRDPHQQRHSDDPSVALLDKQSVTRDLINA